jgi:hypothetical protein
MRALEWTIGRSSDHALSRARGVDSKVTHGSSSPVPAIVDLPINNRIHCLFRRVFVDVDAESTWACRRALFELSVRDRQYGCDPPAISLTNECLADKESCYLRRLTGNAPRKRNGHQDLHNIRGYDRCPELSHVGFEMPGTFVISAIDLHRLVRALNLLSSRHP